MPTKERFYQIQLRNNRQQGGRKTMESRTIPMGPQERAFRLPFIISNPFEEPRGGPIVTGFTCSVVINRRIWWRKPLPDFFS
jgi:hypothetical protein